MQPRVATVGPLVSGSATSIALAQSPLAAGALALNGSAGTFTANNIALSQTVSGAAALILNGTLARPTTPIKVTIGAGGSPIYITSGGNDSGITFTIFGADVHNVGRTEILQGTNAGVVGSSGVYSQVFSITTSGSTSGSGITVGTDSGAKLDMARRVILTSGGNDTGLTFTVTGMNASGLAQSETVTGASGAAASTVLDYLTVTQVLTSGATATTIEVGTNGVASSPWINLDPWALGTVLGQCDVNGTVNYTVEVSNDDPNSTQNPISASAMTWDSTYPGVSAQTGEKVFALAAAPLWIRATLNSGSGSVRMTAVQHGAVPY